MEDEVGDVTENDERASEEEEDDDVELPSSTSPIDERLSKFAKKMPIFEPETRVELSPGEEKPLLVNLDLALYRVKILTRKFQYDEAQNILQKVNFNFF